MRKYLWMAAVAVSAGILAGCGGEELAGSRQGIEAGGVVHRSSFGLEGLESDIKYYQERLEGLQAVKKPDAKAISALSDLVARLEGMRPKDTATPTLQDTCGTSYYELSATVSPGYSVGSATADAMFVEFGPPSPWTKTLLTQAWASSSAGTQYSAHQDTYEPGGTNYEPTAYAQTGPTYNCKRLSAYASISANGCSFYAAEADEFDSCGF